MGDGKTKVSIIIPHYNEKECLEKLFPDLARQTCMDFEVIIIDDCSPDEDAIPFIRKLIEDKPYMRLVQNESNLRFVRTCNKGIKLTEGEYICLLNQDTRLERNFVERNIQILDADPSIGGLTCTVIDQHGKNWFSGGFYRKGYPINLKDDFQGVRSADFIAGTAAFYRRDVFDQAGLFDESYIMYHEDVEFGLRVKQHTSYRLCSFSDKLVTHILVPSFPKKDLWYIGSRNSILLSRKYAPRYLPMAAAQIMFYAVAVNIIRACLDMVKGKFPLSARWMSFAFAGLRGMVEGATAKQSGPSYSFGKTDSYKYNRTASR